ncbi:MAG: endolytic transglycosylase MltG, partial [Nitrospinaceae bacterium]
MAAIWIVIGLFYYQGFRPAGDNTQAQTFEVLPGMTLKQVAKKLQQQGLIRNSDAFQAIAYIQKKQKQIMTGEFSLSPSMLPPAILSLITSGKTVL